MKNKIPPTKALNNHQPCLRMLLLCATLSLLGACSSLSELGSGKSYSKTAYSPDKSKADPQSVDAQASNTVQDTSGAERAEISQATTQATTQAKTQTIQEPVKAVSGAPSDSAASTRASAKQKAPTKEKTETNQKQGSAKKNTENSSIQKPAIEQTSPKASEGVAKQDALHRPAKQSPAQMPENDKPADAPTNAQEGAATDQTPAASVTLESLPQSIGKNWVLNRESASSGRCALFYREQVMSDGQGETPVRLIIDDTSIRFKTRSNIDVSYEQTGVSLDQGNQVPVERVLNDTAIVYEQHFGMLVKELKTAQQLTLSLGFWPTWPVTQAYRLDFDVSDFSFAFNKLEACVKLEKGLH